MDGGRGQGARVARISRDSGLCHVHVMSGEYVITRDMPRAGGREHMRGQGSAANGQGAGIQGKRNCAHSGYSDIAHSLFSH